MDVCGRALRIVSILLISITLMSCEVTDFTSNAISKYYEQINNSKKCKTVSSKIDSQKLKIPFLHSKIESSILKSLSLNQKPTNSLDQLNLAITYDPLCALNNEQSLFFNSKFINRSLKTVKIKVEDYLSKYSHLLKADQCIIGISDNVEMRLLEVPNDPQFKDQKFHHGINTAKSWDIFHEFSISEQETVVVAVIDSGVDILHEDLSSNLWVNDGEIPENGVDDDGNGYIDDIYGYNIVDKIGDPSPVGRWSGFNHGTHVAGLIAAESNNFIGVSGVAPKTVKIMSLNVFGGDDIVDTPEIDEAIRYAIDNGAHVINLSIGGPGNPITTKLALAEAIEAGVSIAVAVGNDDEDLKRARVAPAIYAEEFPGMISVGSVDSETLEKSFFSNYGNTLVEISAPGSNGILSTTPGDNYEEKRGTSMATPLVSGAMAQTYFYFKREKTNLPLPQEVELLVKESAQKKNELKPFFLDGNLLDLNSLAELLVFVFEKPDPVEICKSSN